MPNIVYIATSLDGYIADQDAGLDWLHKIPNPDNLDFGWVDFLGRIDALIMGRNTFETVCGFGGDWPYPKPVFVVSDSLSSIPPAFADKARLISGTPQEIVEQLHHQGLNQLYIDGGQTIQGFLHADLIDEMIITQVPVLLGGGVPLFGELPQQLEFEHVHSEVLLNALVKSHYRRKR